MLITLPENELIRVDGRQRDLSLHCLEGTIWVTNGNGQDYLMGTGTTFTAAGPGVIIVEALGQATVRLQEGEIAARGPGWLRLAVS